MFLFTHVYLCQKNNLARASYSLKCSYSAFIYAGKRLSASGQNLFAFSHVLHRCAPTILNFFFILVETGAKGNMEVLTGIFFFSFTISTQPGFYHRSSRSRWTLLHVFPAPVRQHELRPSGSHDGCGGAPVGKPGPRCRRATASRGRGSPTVGSGRGGTWTQKRAFVLKKKKKRVRCV